MKYLIDTANLEMIEKCNDLLPIAGVTSNPSIIKKEGKIDFFAHLKKIRQIIGSEKTLHVQILAEDNTLCGKPDLSGGVNDTWALSAKL